MAKARATSSHQILQEAFLAKRERQSGFSQAALARNLGVSPMFVSKILTGKKPVPNGRLKKLFHLLDMDVTLQSAYLRATVLEALPNAELKKMALSAMSETTALDSHVREKAERFGVLRQWYNLPILTYIGSDDLESSPEAIAEYFGLSTETVVQALKGLEKAELIEKRNGLWFKKDRHSFFSTTKARSEVRSHHRAMIKRAYAELDKTKQEEFDSRFITGFSIAGNPTNLDRARAMIADFMTSLSLALSEGSGEEVYQLNLQLFPLKAKRAQ